MGVCLPEHVWPYICSGVSLKEGYSISRNFGSAILVRLCSLVIMSAHSIARLPRLEFSFTVSWAVLGKLVNCFESVFSHL